MRSLAPLLFILASAAYAQTWTQLPDFPGTARDDAASFTINGKIYVGTGMEVGWGLTNDWWCFDAVTETWSAIAAMPATPRQYCSAFTVNNTGYVFGGVDGNGALNELWAYSPASNQWEQKSPMPAEARYACAAVEGWNYGIVATGMLQSGAPTKEAWKYWPATDSWEAMTPVPGPSRHRAVAFQGAGGMVIAGGSDSTGTALSDAWSYPVWFEINAYMPEPDLPEGRIDAKAGTDYVQVVAGGASDATTFHADTWSSDTGQWATLPAFPGGPRRGAVGAGIAQNWSNAFFFGLGLDGGLIRHNDWWKLDYATDIGEQAVQRIILYPNPTSNTVSMRWPETWPTARVHLFDALGRTVIDRVLNQGTAMDVGQLSGGRYAVEVQHGTHQLRGYITKLP
ncbi:MAG: T9SS type A sorting domain-containing protein [Bacteroidetes bacterium]|nr:T9SS type A sorting domain-containing protein [Bacteroidota bacterium]MBS1942854.1 T9SS type A sorting domain-containing protein [Bacteroidota bacterium]